MERGEARALAPVDLSDVPFHALSAQEALSRLAVEPGRGLSRAEAARRLAAFGPNELGEEPSESVLEKLGEQLQDPMVRLLLAAAVISFGISYFAAAPGADAAADLPIWIEPVVILLILIANAAIGIYQDFNAEKSVKMLRRMQSALCEVLREGETESVPAAALVPGDVVKLRAGDVVAADGRVFHVFGAEFGVDESAFTGESAMAHKTPESVASGAILAERTSAVFSGSAVQLGAALVAVTATGDGTELGRIKRLIARAREENREELSPIKQQLNDFGESLTKLIVAVCVLIWLISLPRFFDKVHGSALQGALYYFKQAVALGVAAIPEGLPAVITTCLALGTRRMVARKVLVRKLSKVETLGCTTVICSDKTGTLTRNEMFAERLLVIDPAARLLALRAEGEGYGFEGSVTLDGAKPPLADALSQLIAQNCLLNCEASVVAGQPRGLPTECALIALGRKLRPDFDAGRFEKSVQLPFTSFRKMMSYVVRDRESGEVRLLTKGAAEVVLDRASCFIDSGGAKRPLEAEQRRELHRRINDIAHEGFRVLGLAVREAEGCPTLREAEPDRSALEDELCLAGLVALSDPIRKEVPAALRRCREAGIRVAMITGDKEETALAVAARLGLAAAGERSLCGADLDRLSDAQLTERLRRALRGEGTLVFARTNPSHKQQIVRCLKSLSEVVAMTGDGVNDAPALKQASIGIAMGLAGTEVAKEASDIILLDDNFDSIVNAVEEGRAIFANMKAFIKYMISSNIGEVVSILLTSLLGIPEGFNSVQLLWVNLVTDGIPATALCFNPPEPDAMARPPRRRDDPILDRWALARFAIIGSYVGAATVGIFVYYYLGYWWAGDAHPLLGWRQLARWTKCEDWPPGAVPGFARACDYFLAGKQKASTLSLTVLVVIEMLNSLNATSEDVSLLRLGLFVNPWLLRSIVASVLLHCVVLYVPALARLFSVEALGARDWLLVWLFALPVIPLEELLKYIARRATAQRKKAA